MKQTPEGMENAYNVYTRGAYSQSYAILTLDKDLTVPVAKGVDIFGNATDGTNVRGKTLEAAASGSHILKIQYHVYPVQHSWTACHVGGNPQPNFERCYATTGSIEIDGIGMYSYSYIPSEDNRNQRTLQTMSTSMRLDDDTIEKLPNSETFQKFYDYYGAVDYGNQWILAAFHKSATHDFKNGYADFSSYDDKGTAAAVMRATIYMNIWMKVVLELEHAVALCNQNEQEDQIHAWDKAVAFYTGSVAKQADGKYFEGHTLFTLAKEQCMFSATCTDQVELVNGESVVTNHANVNLKVFNDFSQGQQSLIDGDCASAKSSADRIIQQMAVPLIQGVILFAYSTDLGHQFDDASNNVEAAGAVFSASILPLVHHCSRLDAEVLYQNMRVGNGVGRTMYDQIMTLLEKNLECLGLTCQDIGGVADIVHEESVYMPGGEPCHHTNAPPPNSQATSPPATNTGNGATANISSTETTSNSGGPNVGLALGIALIVVVSALVITALASRKKNQKEFDGPAQEFV